MARITEMAASSHHTARRSHPHRSHSASSVVRIAARMCRDAAAANRDCGMWRRKMTGLAAASICFRQESAPHASPRSRWFLSYQDSWSGGVGVSWRATICCRGTGGGAQLGVEQVWEEDQDEDPSLLALEAEIYDFMLRSSKPTHFPTTDELIAARRMDLVQAIAKHGGWLAYGCGFDDGDDDGTGIDDGYGGDEGSGGDGKERGAQLPGGEWTADAISPLHLETGSETIAMEDGGIAVGWQDNMVLQQQRLISDMDSASYSSFSASYSEVEVGEESGIEGILNRLEKERSSSFLEVDNRISSNSKDHDSGSAGAWYTNRTPRVGSILSHGQEGSIQDLHKFCDALEFQETEIMNAQDKLRGLRAKLVALEGKIALDIVEAQRILEEKQRRLNAAQQAMSILRTACVVWPNTASTVFLAGSFDGWTSQMQMEKTSTGIFSLYLKLCPGKYEIKFIVDGVWKVDLLRPVVTNNGHENNLLIIQ
ncbi:hypothetical protein Taro_052077 [Colocasia esculenta]|uniref:AMP-activated protein kinase glycogen-binding domain-containing protein n=1 Tax=Colocasia esculenta TaxID=4460 RepID=A0A843XJ56_COLES|nr:hypothetical protein [Colocasia esculenta]